MFSTLHVRRLAASALTAVFFVSATAVAQDDDDSASELDLARILDRISITGSAEDIEEIPGSAHSVGRTELDRHSYQDIHRILRTVPGVNLHEEEGFGLFPHIGLRGTRLERSSRVTLMEDGVLIAPAPYAAPSAYYFPQTARMSRVEIRKGSAAIEYGPYTTGGAVNLMSTPVPGKFSGKADLLFGEHDSRRAHAWLGGSDEQWGWLVEGFSAASDGFKRLDPAGDTGGPNAPVPDTGFEADNFVGKLRWTSNGSGPYQAFELKIARDERTANETYLGLAADDFAADPFRRYRGSQLDQINTEHDQIQLTHFIMPTANVDITTTIYNNEFARNWYKLHAVQNEAGGGFSGISAILGDPASHAGAFDWIRGDEADGLLGNVRANNREYYSRGIDSRLAWTFATGDVDHDLHVGLRYHEDEEDRLQWQDSFRMENGTMVLVRPGDEIGSEGNAETGVPGSTTNRVTQAEATALSVQDTIRFGNFTLTPGFRFEDISLTRRDFQDGDDPDRSVVTSQKANSVSAFLPGMGAIYRLDGGWTLLAGAHRGFAPTGFSTEEKSWNYEAGARYRQGGLQAAVIGFHTRYDNLVGVCTAASGGGCEIGEEFDGGRVDVSGLEAELSYDFGRANNWAVDVPVSVAYTLTDSEFKSSFESGFGEWGEVERGDELPQIPPQQINFSVGFIWDMLALRINANHVAETRAVAGSGSIAQDNRIESRTLVDIAAEYRVHDHASVFASLENATDQEYLAARRPAGLRPGKPRTGWVGVKFDF